MLVVSPAAFATAAAIFAGKPEFMNPEVASPLAASLAGAAAVLSAIHKALRCEEYQAECVRLGTAYQRIAILASDPDQSLKDITEEFAKVAETAKRKIELGTNRIPIVRPLRSLDFNASFPGDPQRLTPM